MNDFAWTVYNGVSQRANHILWEIYRNYIMQYTSDDFKICQYIIIIFECVIYKRKIFEGIKKMTMYEFLSVRVQYIGNMYTYNLFY